MGWLTLPARSVAVAVSASGPSASGVVMGMRQVPSAPTSAVSGVPVPTTVTRRARVAGAHEQWGVVAGDRGWRLAGRGEAEDHRLGRGMTSKVAPGPRSGIGPPPAGV